MVEADFLPKTFMLDFLFRQKMFEKEISWHWNEAKCGNHKTPSESELDTNDSEFGGIREKSEMPQPFAIL